MTREDDAIHAQLRQLALINIHVHTNCSRCATAEMNPAAIVAAADQAGLQKVILTDHHHPGEPDQHLTARIAGVQDAVHRNNGARLQVMVGAELSAFGCGQFADAWETSCVIPFRLYACNHYHVMGWEHPVRADAHTYKQHSLKVMHALIASGRAHCIAHPFVGTYLRGRIDDPGGLTALYSDAEITAVFEAARRHNVAMEINTGHLLRDIPFARRFIRLGFAARAGMLIGTDAHRLADIDPRPKVEELIAKTGAPT